ncbi:MAG: flagellar hook-length control protein FliK [Alicyclobacillaceae bacterium]|nr:flagellar hook-length control protein FliK [Alicyclobacillaceae bacterium]
MVTHPGGFHRQPAGADHVANAPLGVPAQPVTSSGEAVQTGLDWHPFLGQPLTGVVLKEIQAGKDRMRVKVHPEGMGEIAISVHRNPAGIQVELTASQVQTTNLLTGEIQRLAEDLRSAGFALTGVRVSWAGSDAGADGLFGSLEDGPGTRDRLRAATSGRSVGRASGIVTEAGHASNLPGDNVVWGVPRWQALNVRV